MEVMPDHVHLLLDRDPQFGINRLVRSIKGLSAHLLRSELAHRCRQYRSIARFFDGIASHRATGTTDAAALGSAVARIIWIFNATIGPEEGVRKQVAKTPAIAIELDWRFPSAFGRENAGPRSLQFMRILVARKTD